MSVTARGRGIALARPNDARHLGDVWSKSDKLLCSTACNMANFESFDLASPSP
jgi:hypothetical protein